MSVSSDTAGVTASPDAPDVTAAVDSVLDPCSTFNGTRLTLRELGMIEQVTVEDSGAVVVLLLMDDPTCIFFFEISRLLREALAAVPGVGQVDIEIKSDEIWTEDRMQPRARSALAELRSVRRRALERRAGTRPVPVVLSAGRTSTGDAGRS